MPTTIERNSEYNPREWLMMVGALMLHGFRKSDSEPKPALWKQFDDTHRWDSTAEEWVRREDQ